MIYAHFVIVIITQCLIKKVMIQILQKLHQLLNEQKFVHYCSDDDVSLEYVARYFKQNKYKVEKVDNVAIKISKKWWMK